MTDRIAYYRQRIGELSYERLKLTRQVEQIDKTIGAYEGALEAAEQAKRDADTQAAINAAKEKSECQSS